MSIQSQMTRLLLSLREIAMTATAQRDPSLPSGDRNDSVLWCHPRVSSLGSTSLSHLQNATVLDSGQNISGMTDFLRRDPGWRRLTERRASSATTTPLKLRDCFVPRKDVLFLCRHPRGSSLGSTSL